VLLVAFANLLIRPWSRPRPISELDNKLRRDVAPATCAADSKCFAVLSALFLRAKGMVPVKDIIAKRTGEQA